MKDGIMAEVHQPVSYWGRDCAVVLNGSSEMLP